MNNIISKIKTESLNLNILTDDELSLKIEKIKKRVINEPLENILSEWFAIVQETSFRQIGLKHFDTQLAAGVLLHEGKIVEMKTGEGKTLASTLPITLNALQKKGVHVVTVNEYLAERDQKWMGKIYKGLGLSVGISKNINTTEEKRKSYYSDITYLTNSELVFDYLRDCSAYTTSQVVQRPLHFCIIDEIDSILIDEARTPLILSSSGVNDTVHKFFLAKRVAKILEKQLDFEIDEKKRDINLTERGYKNAKEQLGKKTLYDPEDPWILELLNALKAEYIYKLNKDYVILNGKILIVDEFTGRIMEDRRWSLGIHEAIETKENLEIGGKTKTKSSITYQNFFTLYPKLSGMTGTGKTTEKEFQDIYGLEVNVLPTSKPLIRKDLPDLVYQNEISKWKAVLNQAKTCFSIGQPLLIGTSSVEKSEFLSDLFKISQIPHQILNAKPENVKRESEIIAQAGKKNAVTIATNMAGRGTDIILGGNPIFEVKQEIIQCLQDEKKEGPSSSDVKLKELINSVIKDSKESKNKKKLNEDLINLPYSIEESFTSLKDLYSHIYQKIYTKWEIENKTIKDLGGLFVLGTERHETRRIDNQLRGRAGRQGDPGNSQFFISLEDDLIKIFGGENIRKWIEYLVQDKDMPLESNVLTTSLENAQKKVELYNYDLRKNVFQYDEILNTQRKALFKGRRQILVENMLDSLILRFNEFSLDETMKEKKYKDEEVRFSLEYLLDCYATTNIEKEKKILYQEAWINHDLKFAISNTYQKGFLKNSKIKEILEIFDFYWTEHLERMSYIRETINWRSYGQQNPLLEYNNEAFNSFKIMFEEMRNSMLYYFIRKKINL